MFPISKQLQLPDYEGSNRALPACLLGRMRIHVGISTGRSHGFEGQASKVMVKWQPKICKVVAHSLYRKAMSKAAATASMVAAA